MERASGLWAAFGDGDEAEMSVRRMYMVVAAQDAEDGDAEGFYSVAEHGLVDSGADAVENGACDSRRWVECRISVDHSGYGAGHRPGVDDEHYGCLEQPGDVGCGGEIPASLAVEEAHDAFDYGYVSTLCTVGEERADEVGAGEESVEVASRPACGEGVVRGVYKVGADLEGGDPKALQRERGHESRSNSRLADP